MKRRDFLINSAAASSVAFLPAWASPALKKDKVKTAHIGVGGMGMADLKAISSHKKVEVYALCDVDSKALKTASAMFPKAKTYKDYRKMLRELENDIDAVVVSTPDHSHAPASLMAMKMDKHVYCQKPLTHHVSEARAMNRLANERKLITQMGIQVHSFYDYKLATLLIQSGIIGKVKRVHAWSPKSWGYDGPEPKGSDPVPETLDWNLWLGTAKDRPYKKGYYHPGNWRKVMDYGCGTLGDMGVHIFDTPYNALALDVPTTITNNCRQPNGFGFPENNTVTYEFPSTEYTTDNFKWHWYDGPGMPPAHEDLVIPGAKKKSAKKGAKEKSVAEKISLDAGVAGKGELPEQGAMFVGTEGRLLLPHFMQLPQKIVDGKYVDISKEIAAQNLGEPVRDYDGEGPKHYHQFVDTILGTDSCTAPFSYASRLTETILLGVIAGRFPNQTLHWDRDKAEFKEKEANQYLSGTYRDF
jgi:predicted dehydrogenase